MSQTQKETRCSPYHLFVVTISDILHLKNISRLIFTTLSKYYYITVNTTELHKINPFIRLLFLHWTGIKNSSRQSGDRAEDLSLSFSLFTSINSFPQFSQSHVHPFPASRCTSRADWGVWLFKTLLYGAESTDCYPDACVRSLRQSLKPHLQLLTLALSPL